MVIQTFEIYNLKMEITFSSKHGEFRIKISESFTATSIFSLILDRKLFFYMHFQINNMGSLNCTVRSCQIYIDSK